MYRDNGLALLTNTSKQKADQIRKVIVKIFKNSGFKIEIKTNLHIVDFLDITFYLLDETYKLYKKPNDQLLMSTYHTTDYKATTNIYKESFIK